MDWYRGGVTRRHYRFALQDVMFAGTKLPGATIDRWEDDRGDAQWSARVVARLTTLPDQGELSGRTNDGRVVTGHVVIGERHTAEGGRRETLIEFHGQGALSVATETSA
jgi:hypothetical protein